MVRRAIEFGPFRLDTDPDRLWRGSEEVPLRRRSLSVLAYLARRPGRLVTKDELREQVWGAAHVSDTTLRVTVREIRAALGDDTPGSSYLETVPGRGYRFLAHPKVSSGLDSAASQREDRPPAGQDEPIVGRRREIEYLMNRFLEADKGRRQLVFVPGEPGAGKTTLCRLFMERLAGRPEATLVGAQCVMSFGAGEAYGPVLEALLGTGARAHLPHCLALLAELCLREGRIDAAGERLAEARAQAESSGERYWEAELHRLEGEVLLAAGDNGNPDNDSSDRAEACFKTALEVASRQQAKSLKLRAALSLSRLWSPSRSDEARQVLGGVLETFTEGHDTADLRAAREQMAQLSLAN